MKYLPRRIAGLTAGVTLAVGAVVANPAPASAAPVSVTIPLVAIHNPIFTPPEGIFEPFTVSARPQQQRTVFTIIDPVPDHPLWAFKYVVVHWRNLGTGKAGTTLLRISQRSGSADGFPTNLPLSATAETGSGPIFATVELRGRDQWTGNRAPAPHTPGLSFTVG